MDKLQTELRTLRVLDKSRDPRANQWDGLLVTVTGWYCNCIPLSEHINGRRLHKVVWWGKIKEVPDRHFTEQELVKECS